MKYIKLYEIFLFDIDFSIGDIVICIDDSDSSNELEMLNKYIVVDNDSSMFGQKNMMTLQEYATSKSVGNWFKERFIKEKDLENWETQNNIIKYNI